MSLFRDTGFPPLDEEDEDDEDEDASAGACAVFCCSTSPFFGDLGFFASGVSDSLLLSSRRLRGGARRFSPLGISGPLSGPWIGLYSISCMRCARRMLARLEYGAFPSYGHGV